jgi:phage baseplate assembly protein W
VISLKLTNIAPSKGKEASLEKGFLYKDVLLDFEDGYTYNNQLNTKAKLNDIVALFDLDAVKNSIKTCFLTSPGQKILSPEYGIDLRQYLFEPITADTAFFIRDDIFNNLPRFEPRVTVQGVSVIPDPDNNQYNITLQIDVPSLNIYGVSLKNALNSNGYY